MGPGEHSCLTGMKTTTNPGVKFLGYMRLQKLHEVVVRVESAKEVPDAGKLANAFAEVVQCLGDRSLALVIREAKEEKPYKSCENTIKERANRASLRFKLNSPH